MAYFEIIRLNKGYPMKRMFLILLLLGTIATQAQNIINFNMGPVWPKAFQENDSKTAWSGAFEYGWVFDKRIVIGGKIDFLWEIARTYQDGSSTGIAAKSKLFMIPISFFLHFDPIPQYALHPVARVQIGYNSMAISHDGINGGSANDPIQFSRGYYYGFIAKLGADAVIDVGKQAAFFTGFEYTIAPKTTNGTETVNMNAPGIRMGLSILF